MIEVADSSLEFDRGRKVSLYAAAGIPDIWIANLRTGAVEIRTDPTDGEYATVRTVPRDVRISPQAFPDVALELGEFMPPAAQ